MNANKLLQKRTDEQIRFLKETILLKKASIGEQEEEELE
jgi:hypothetical protein